MGPMDGWDCIRTRTRAVRRSRPVSLWSLSRSATRRDFSLAACAAGTRSNRSSWNPEMSSYSAASHGFATTASRASSPARHRCRSQSTDALTSPFDSTSRSGSGRLPTKITRAASRQTPGYVCARMKRLVFVVLCGITASLAAQQPPGPTFEVTSIKPNRENYGGWYNLTPTRYTATGNTVVQLVSLAYDLRPYRVADAPEWTRTERFDIQASIAGPRVPGDLRVMLRELLEKRFALRVHREKRPMEVFVLSMARTDGQPGAGLKRIARTCSDKPQTPEERCGHVEPPGSYRSTGERWEAVGFVNFIER